MSSLFFITTACNENKDPDKPAVKPTPPTIAEQKKALSERKLLEVRDLRAKLTEKIGLLEKTSGQFDQEISNCENEIRVETTKQPMDSFAQAIKNRRIKAALEAIQKAQAYKEIVTRESQLANDAAVDTEGIETQLRLDGIILTSIEEAKLDELLVKLELVIDNIQPQAKELVLTDAQTNLKPLEEIYKELIPPGEKPAAPPTITSPTDKTNTSEKQLDIGFANDQIKIDVKTACESASLTYRNRFEKHCRQKSQSFKETYECRMPFYDKTNNPENNLCLLKHVEVDTLRPPMNFGDCVIGNEERAEYCCKDSLLYRIEYAQCGKSEAFCQDRNTKQMKPCGYRIFCRTVKSLKQINLNEFTIGEKLNYCFPLRPPNIDSTAKQLPSPQISLESPKKSSTVTFPKAKRQPLVQHNPEPCIELEPSIPTGSSIQNKQPADATPDADEMLDALERCQDALDDDNCKRAQTLCTNDLINKFPWVELRLKNCWKLAALDKCRNALDDDNCEQAQTLCADITLKDYEWIDTAIKACWEFKKF